tara:strand:- start:805 stop:1953 length:1149 start_codon:yes stop_codon:yes gene_type:complete
VPVESNEPGNPLLRMPPRRRNKHKNKASTGATKAAPEGEKDIADLLADNLDAELTLKDEVAEAVSGLKGYDLAKKLHKEAVNMFNQSVAGDGLAPDVRDALRITHELRCASPGPNPVPQPVLPYMMWRKLEECSYTKGRINLESSCDIMAVGKFFVDLADSCMNRAAENIDILKRAAADPLGVLQPFIQIQGLQQASKYTTTDEMCMLACLVKNIVPAGINSVTVKSSPLHGNGVFAKRPIKKGEIITMYPCHAFLLCVEGVGTLWAMTNGENMLRTTASMLAGYSAEVEPTRISIAGDPDIYTNDACGHLINDGACIMKKDFDVNDVLKYIEDSLRAQNCHFISLAGCALAVMASRNIKTGEEVLAAYGAGFWSKYAHGEI